MYLGLGDIIPVMENQKEKNMDMEWTLGLHREGLRVCIE